MGAQGAAVDANIWIFIESSEASNALWSIVHYLMNDRLHSARKVSDTDRYVRGLSLSGITVAQLDRATAV